jgi:hypothetical protein
MNAVLISVAKSWLVVTIQVAGQGNDIGDPVALAAGDFASSKAAVDRHTVLQHKTGVAVAIWPSRAVAARCHPNLLPAAGRR